MFLVNRFYNLVLPLLRTRSFHSKPLSVNHLAMQVHLLPALEDNFMYLLVDDATKEAAVVDPVEPAKVVAAVERLGLKLSTVLTTHHHWDHAGGNVELTKLVSGLQVVGGDDRIGALNRTVGHGDHLKLGQLSISCLATPCHTTGHICYFVKQEGSSQEPVVFTGDTLFVGGCGKFFEGTPEQMYSSLIEKLSALPDSTHVYCGHEYALSNLAFAKHVEPENEALLAKIKWVEERRGNNEPSVPSTIGDEKKYNPFMRVNEPIVRKHANDADNGITAMGFIRKEKDAWKAPTV
ncbi:Hydroxyacylglutathione hydrolase, mitochondrial [Halotydeus destructor]|nr:Hydroxyacylglutathione hydrolase, mitochondrial [Halotydeus destructor]